MFTFIQHLNFIALNKSVQFARLVNFTQFFEDSKTLNIKTKKKC